MIVSIARFDQVVGHGQLDLHLGDEVDGVLGAAVHLGVPLLAAEAADLGDGHAVQLLLGQRVFDVVELEMPDNGLDLFHAHTPWHALLRPSGWPSPARGVSRTTDGPECSGGFPTAVTARYCVLRHTGSMAGV